LVLYSSGGKDIAEEREHLELPGTARHHEAYENLSVGAHDYISNHINQ